MSVLKQQGQLKLANKQICNAYAKLNGKTAGKLLALDDRRFQQFHIIPHEGSFGLLPLLPGKTEVAAVLDTDTCSVLQCLHDHQGTRATAVVKTRSSKGIFPLSINIYGIQSEANAVGDKLSEKGAFLQHPFFLEPGCEYFNPQYLHFGGEMKCMTNLVGLSETEYRAKRISDEVERVFDSLDTTDPDDSDAGLDAQPDAIITPLKRYVFIFATQSVSNFVNSHQKAALAFIRCRENYDACQRANKSLRSFVRIRSVAHKKQVHIRAI